VLVVEAPQAGHFMHAWVRYQNGSFEPTDPPGGSPPCDASTFVQLANEPDPGISDFDHVACADGWGLATGHGFGGQVLGLFNQSGSSWMDISIPIDPSQITTYPTTYGIPLALLHTLAQRIGVSLPSG